MSALRVSEPGMLHEWRQLTAERGSMASVQVEFVGPAIQAELDGLVSCAAGQIVL
jgi:hypothetical protein